VTPGALLDPVGQGSAVAAEALVLVSNSAEVPLDPLKVVLANAEFGPGFEVSKLSSLRY
jgi:hypothetical protein